MLLNKEMRKLEYIPHTSYNFYEGEFTFNYAFINNF